MTSLDAATGSDWVRQINKRINALERRGSGRSVAAAVAAAMVIDQPTGADDEEVVSVSAATDYGPVVPSQAYIVSSVGSVTLGWDGLGAGGEAIPSSFEMVEIHRSMEGPYFETDSGITRVGDMYGPAEHTFADQEYGDIWWYRLVMVTRGGPFGLQRSGPSEPTQAVAVQVAPADVSFSAIDIDDGTIQGAVDDAASAVTQAQAALAAAAAAEAAATQAAASANGKNKVTWSLLEPGSEANTVGDTWFQFDADEVVIAQWRGKGGTDWEQVSLGHQVISSVDAGAITVGLLRGDQLEANTIQSQHLESVLAVINKLVSAAAGRRWEADPDGIRLYDIDNTLIVNFPTDPDATASITGDLVATSLTVMDQLALRGLINEITAGAQLVLAGGITPPTSPPTLSVGWEYGTATAPTPGDAMYRYGWHYYAGWYYTVQDDSPNDPVIHQYDATTLERSTSPFAQTVVPGFVTGRGGVVVIDDIAYVLGQKDDSTWWVMGLQLGNGLVTTEWQYPQNATHSLPVIGADQYGHLMIGLVNTTNKVFQWRHYNKTTGVQMGAVQTTNWLTDKTPRALLYGAFDYGSGRIIAGFDSDTQTFAFTTSGDAHTRLNNDDFAVATGSKLNGLAWNSATGQFTHLDSAASRVYAYTGHKWGSGSETWWASATWYDDNATGGTHETPQGPRGTVNMRKRARLVVTPPPFPARPLPNTSDDVTAARIYLGHTVGGASDPGRTQMQLQAQCGQSGLLISNASLPAIGAAAANPPPVSTNFPASAPGRIISADGTTIVINGDGTATIGGLSFEINDVVNGNAAVMNVGKFAVGTYPMAGFNGMERRYTTTWTATNAAYTKMQPNSLVAGYENDGVMYSAGVFTALVAGFYSASASVIYPSTTGTNRIMRLANGTNTEVYRNNFQPASASIRSIGVAWTGWLAAGDTLAAWFYHDIGSNATMAADSTADPVKVCFVRLA